MKINLNPTRYSAERPEMTREAIALFVAGVIQGGTKGSCFQPYMPNKDDDLYWVVDSGNNWRLQFAPDNSSFELRYRYHHDGIDPVVRALYTWIAYRLGGTVEEQSSDQKEITPLSV